MNVISFLSKVDPKKIEIMFPSKDWYEKYEKAMEKAGAILKNANPNEIDPLVVQELESATKSLINIYSYLVENTELGSKSRLNEAVLMAEYKYVERSIYLAGLAREKNIKEPYRTQIAVLPANACLYRYRQAFNIEEWIKDNIQAEPPGKVAVHLKQMKASHLQQMHYFTTQAHMDNPGHVYAAYLKMLSSLLMGFSLEQAGKDSTAKVFYSNAEAIIDNMSEPSESSHYMELQYLTMSSEEFKDFKRLSKKFKKIKERLTFLNKKASEILEKGRFNKPKEYFAFTPYVAVGGRVASVAGLICLAGTVSGLNPNDISLALDQIWASAESTIPGFTESDFTAIESIASPEMVAVHTSGFANTSEVIESLNESRILAMAHTGGFA